MSTSMLISCLNIYSSFPLSRTPMPVRFFDFSFDLTIVMFVDIVLMCPILRTNKIFRNTRRKSDASDSTEQKTRLGRWKFPAALRPPAVPRGPRGRGMGTSNFLIDNPIVRKSTILPICMHSMPQKVIELVFFWFFFQWSVLFENKQSISND